MGGFLHGLPGVSHSVRSPGYAFRTRPELVRVYLLFFWISKMSVIDRQMEEPTNGPP